MKEWFLPRLMKTTWWMIESNYVLGIFQFLSNFLNIFFLNRETAIKLFQFPVNYWLYIEIQFSL